MLLLSAKLKNAIGRECGDMSLTFSLRNILINGAKRGCSGYIRNTENGSVVYVNTERCVYGGVKNFMFRYADSEKDTTGYRNHWADTLEELVAEIASMLKTTPAEAREYKWR